MLWRHRCLVRAWSAAGLVCSLIALGGSIATAQSENPAPESGVAAGAGEPSSAPLEVGTQTVSLLTASQAGDLSVEARGQGQDRVRLTVKNRSNRRLQVIVPPGLVAASAVTQARPGGMQSMGLGAATNREGAFGEFQAAPALAGLRSIPPTDLAPSRQVTVPVGESVELSIPAVCLNFGLPSPTPRDVLTLKDIDEYSPDPRVRKALRSLATLGTSHGVAQATMWRVCNDLTFETMAEQAGKIMNQQEIALAARFVDALDASTSADLIDPATLSRARVFMRIQGEGALSGDAKRLNSELAGQRLLGMPLEVVESDENPAALAPALWIKVSIAADKAGVARARMAVSSCGRDQNWLPLGKFALSENLATAALDVGTVVRAADRALAANFVTVKPARRTVGSTTLKLENRLPFTIVNLVLKAGSSSGAPSVAFEGVGAGPGRSVLLPLQAATASLVESIELNGL